MWTILPKAFGMLSGLFSRGEAFANKNQKSSTSLAGFGLAALGYWGIGEADIVAVGTLLNKAGTFMGGATLCGG